MTTMTQALSPRTFSFSVALRFLGQMAETRRQRLALAKLDDTRLADIGITHGQAHAEVTRPARDVPAHQPC